MEQNPFLFKCWLCIVISFQIVQHEKEAKKVNLQKNNLPDTPIQVIKVYINSDIILIVPTLEIMKWHFISVVTPPPITLPQSNHMKNIRKIPTEWHFNKYLTSTPQNFRGHSSEVGKNKKLLQPMATWSTKGHIVLWVRSWKRNRTLGKK